MRSFLLLALPACAAAQHLAPLEWHDQPPEAPCEVQIVDTDGMGDFARTERYDAAGHLLFGTMRLTYDGAGVEQVTWSGDHVASIESFHHQQARQGHCDVVGGCDEPEIRTVVRINYRYDGTHLVEEASTKRTYTIDRAGAWVQRAEEHRTRRFRYDHDRPIAIDTIVDDANGTDYLDYDSDHLVARRAGKARYTYQWQDGHLAAYHWGDYTQTYEHDAEGRLVREVISNADRSHGRPQTTTWSYDAGRLARKGETSELGGGERVSSYSYDEAGRLVGTDMGLARQTRTYVGTCANNLAQPVAPSALQRAGGAVCIQSPAKLVNTCD